MDMATDTRDIMLELQKEGRVFRLFTEDDIYQIAPHFKAYNFPEGSVVTKPCEPMDMMGMMVSGEVVVEEETELKGNWIVLARLTRGALFINPSLFGGDPSPVRVIAQRDTTFLGINELSFDALLDQHPRIGIKLMKEIIRVIQARLRGLTVRFVGVF
jgi:CRP-like cAMP-binding protein